MPEKESTEFHKKHRPRKLAEVIGQDKAVSSIRKALKQGKIPHAMLLNGPTGTGKTTLMRILRRILKCSERDYIEINTADFRGIDTIRDLRKNLHLLPFGGGETRVIGIDECHMLSKDAQNAILKMLEDTPEHVYFILGTTDPQKLLPAILGRCAEYKLRALDEEDLTALIKSVCEKEKLEICQGVIAAIAEAAGGSARKALVILDAVSKEESEEDQERAIQITTVNKDLSYKLASSLMAFKGNPSWNEVAALLRELKDEEPEGVRYMVLAFARSCMIGKGDKPPQPKNVHRAALLINEFGTHFYDSKNAGLAFACYNVVHAGQRK